ncbi:hypothetical protein [Actinoplanes sp. NPDC026619]|uniref:hypothetical protein n=1 Tax=Actinoplanes sp. NPDC026619 TaxID=3155798 RepID=UPI0033D25509
MAKRIRIGDRLYFLADSTATNDLADQLIEAIDNGNAVKIAVADDFGADLILVLGPDDLRQVEIYTGTDGRGQISL